jgi:hypothetical protein
VLDDADVFRNGRRELALPQQFDGVPQGNDAIKRHGEV